MPMFLLSFSVFSSSLLIVSILSTFMASSSSNKKTNNAYKILPAASFEEKPSTHWTTYIQTDEASFKAVVQKFTALRDEKPPATTHKSPPAAARPPSGEMGAPRPPFKLHERRQGGTMLEIKLNNNFGGGAGVVVGVGVGGGGGGRGSSSSPSSSSSSSGSSARPRRLFGFNVDKVMISPVSPLEVLARGNPRTPRTPSSLAPMDEEMRGIYEKGYYFHPNSATPEGVKPPQLLPLFPVRSPRDDDDDDDHEENENSSSSS